MKHKQVITIILFLLTVAGVAEAKWWIFGQANEEVSISYLYVNEIPYEDSGQKVTMYRDMLTGGEIVLRGKAWVAKGKLGGASISLDNRESWKEAQFSSDGAFEYRFKPETGKTYVIYVEVVDTAGKSNDVASTRKELIIAGGSFQQQVRQALDALISAYKAEDPAAFMRSVSEDFVADPAILDRAIRKDFSLFDNIDLRYTLNNVASGKGGIIAALTFSRQVTGSRDGKTYSDKGATEFVFKPTDQGIKVFSMKFPLIFGLSDAAELATGTVNSGNNEPTIVVTGNGTVTTVPLAEALFGSTSSAGIESGSNIAITSFAHPPQGFDFVSGTPDNGSGAAFFITGGDLNFAYGFLGSGCSYKDLGAVSINSVSEVPATGYISGTGGQSFYQGHTYAFLLANGKYALLELRSVNVTFVPAYSITVRINYKYQPNGSRQF